MFKSTSRRIELILRRIELILTYLIFYSETTSESAQCRIARDIFDGRSRVRIHEIFSRLPDRFAPRRTQTWVDMVAATGFHPWLHTLFESTILLPSPFVLPLERSWPLFDPVHDSSGEGATQPEYLRVRETSERSKKEEKEKRRTRTRSKK